MAAPGDIGILSPWEGRSLDDRIVVIDFWNGGPTRHHA